MFKGLVALFTIISISFKSFATDPVQLKGYDINKPDKTIILPEELNEISGATWVDKYTVVCVQDEKGILYVYDLVNNVISHQYKFNIDGDYEGITKVNNSIFVLRSDGTLFEIENYNMKSSKLNTYVLQLPTNNNEGLCYDADNNRLLIAAKSNVGKGPENKDKRVIYGFDLAKKKLESQAIYNFDLAEIKKFAVDKNAEVPVREKKKGKASTVKVPMIRFRASAIDIHPITKKLYLLSAADHLLFVFDQKGNVEHIENLDPVKFNKSEGITFNKSGDMIITNEAQEKKPTLLQFTYKSN